MKGRRSSSDSSSSSKTKKPQYSKFTQQELSACKPILTPGYVIGIFIIVGVIFIPVGIISLFASENVVEIVDRYDEGCIPPNYSDDMLAYIQNSDTNKTCTRSLKATKLMKSPVYIYYQLDNFYQNHRRVKVGFRYVKSRNDKQLWSKKHEDDTKNCAPEATSNGLSIVPCGLIAWSLFNDSYGFSIKNKMVKVSKKNIAWESDKKNKFGSDVYPKNFQNGVLIGGGKLNSSIPLSKQEDLIVWMRTAALPTFRKLYGRIESDIQANDSVTVIIENNYNTYSFGGHLGIQLSCLGTGIQQDIRYRFLTVYIPHLSSIVTIIPCVRGH
ncbi:ALA-interacting subunit [Citrus sinensis]|uniref:ALA-interacting subunit n=1 Tax=Citrus sinensis TaxID=2711 RepID=A0ACB8K0M4_CITSI|nr:ALA-interacting subunit [Citrus sinensis]